MLAAHTSMHREPVVERRLGAWFEGRLTDDRFGWSTALQDFDPRLVNDQGLVADIL
jgi:hypothetical protein